MDGESAAALDTATSHRDVHLKKRCAHVLLSLVLVLVVTYSLTHSFTGLVMCANSLTILFTCVLTYPLTHSPTHVLTYLRTYALPDPGAPMLPSLVAAMLRDLAGPSEVALPMLGMPAKSPQALANMYIDMYSDIFYSACQAVSHLNFSRLGWGASEL